MPQTIYLNKGMDLLLSFMCIALTISFLFSLYKLLSSQQSAPPGPAPLPVLGNLLNLYGNQPHHTFARLAKVYGPIMSLKIGLTTTVVVSSPEAAREVLQKKDASFSSKPVPDSLRAYNNHERMINMLPSTSPAWRHYRAISATNLFSARALERTREIRAQKAGDIINGIRKKSGNPLDIGKIIFAGMVNIVSNVLFSQDVVDINSESPQEFTKIFKETISEILKVNISDFYPFLRVFDLQGRRREAGVNFQRFYKFFDVIIDARLHYRSSSERNYGDFLDSLLDLYEESKTTRQEIQSLLMEIYGAAIESTSKTVEWAMRELLRDPNAMARAQFEVREGQTMSEQDIVNLPYLQAVIKETMRLHPTAPFLPRKAMEEGLDIGGYRVPKGAQVLVNIWAIGRDPQIWSEPDVFRPERFLEKQISFHGQDFEFIPFGSGKRMCAGLSFAVRVVPLVLGLLLAKFDWRLPDGMEPKDIDFTEKFATVLEPAVPFYVVPIPIYN